MKKINLIERLLSYSHEKQSPQRFARYAVMLIMLLTLGVGQMWGDTTFADGDVLFYDFSDVTGGGGVNWQCNGSDMVYDPSGAGTIKCVIFTSSTTWNTSWTVAKTAKGSWGNINMPEDRPDGKNCLKINAEGTGASWTTISLAEKVAKGDLIMVYGGELSSWNQSKYYFIGSNDNTTNNTKAFANANKSITINSETYKFGPAALPSGTYIQGHWDSNLSCAIAAGSAYVVRGTAFLSSDYYSDAKATSGDNSLYQVKKQSSAPTTSLTPTCPSSIAAGSKLPFTPGSAGVSVLGRSNTIKYYLKSGSTYTEKTLSDGKIDVSELGVGDYSIITLLYDGYIYVKASTSNFTVASSYTVTFGASPAAAADAPTNDASISSGDHLISGTSITFTKDASPNSGYTWKGWYDNEEGDGDALGTGNTYTTTLSSDIAVYAIYTPNTYSVVFNKNHEEATGTMSNQAFTYAVAQNLTSNAFVRDGYRFDGWATASDGNVVYNDGQSVSNLTAEDGGTFNLYAHWTKSELTNIALTPTDYAVQEEHPTITATPTLSISSGIGTTSICWGLYTDAGCTTPVDVSFSPNPSGGAGAVTFNAPDAAGTYYLKAIFRAGSTCEGTELNSFTKSFIVHPTHTVTVKAKVGEEFIPDAEYNQTSHTVTVNPHRAKEVAVPDIAGYTFVNWTLGENMAKTDAELTANPIHITATADDNLTANYNYATYEVTYPEDARWTFSDNDASVTYKSTGHFTVTPAAGYSITVTASDASGSVTLYQDGNLYSFTQGTSTVTISVSPTEVTNTITVVNGTPTSVTAQVVTAVSDEVTADDADDGKKFLTWYLGTGIELVGCDTTDRTIAFHASQNTTITAVYTDRTKKTVHFAKPTSWSTVTAKFSNSSGSVDPSDKMTHVSTFTYEGATYYTFFYYTDNNREGDDQSAHASWDRVTFSDDGSTADGKHMDNLTITDGYYYAIGAPEEDEGVATPFAEWYLRGELNKQKNWEAKDNNSFFLYPFSVSGTTAEFAFGAQDIASNDNQYFRLYRVTTGEWFRTKEGDGDKTLTIPATETLYVNSSNADVISTNTAEKKGVYLFRITNIHAANPGLTVTHPVDTKYGVTITAEDDGAHGSLSGETGSITQLGRYMPTDISATANAGYRFKEWVTTGGVVVKDPTNRSTTATATADGTITATFTNEGIVYLDKNAISGAWTITPYVYFYSSSYWDKDKGSGSKNILSGGHAMTQIGSTNIWYYDYSSTPGIDNTKNYIAFTNGDKSNQNNFDQTSAIYRGDFYPAMNMFVPQNNITAYLNKHDSKQTAYYNSGYWMKYNEEESGYNLRVYDGQGNHLQEVIHFTTSSVGSRDSYTATLHVDGAASAKFELVGHDQGWKNGIYYDGTFYGNTGTINWTISEWNWEYTHGTGKAYINLNSNGDYVFTLNCKGDGKLYVKVAYPISVGDFRIKCNGLITTEDDSKGDMYSDVIPQLTEDGTRKDTVSFFVTNQSGKEAALSLEKVSSINSSDGVITWGSASETFSGSTISSLESGVYMFEIVQTKSGETTSFTYTNLGKYDGKYFVRTDCANGGWVTYKQNEDNLMRETNYASAGYNRYFCRYVPSGSVKFCVANEYNSQLSKQISSDAINTAGDGSITVSANTRFEYDNTTNKVSRSYIGSSADATFLYILDAAPEKIYKANGDALTDHKGKFNDDENWIYSLEVQATPGATYQLKAEINGHTQFFDGTESAKTLLGGSGDKQKMRLVYDFKNNHLIKAWLPNGVVSGTFDINADVMLLREGQNAATQLSFSDGSKLTSVKNVYGVLGFKKTDMTNGSLSSYERSLYWVSFPFDVKLKDIFGFGKYGEDFIVRRYNGAKRAEKGWFLGDGTTTFWETMSPDSVKEADNTMKAYEGYMVALDKGLFIGSDSRWYADKKEIDELYLYFPSASAEIGELSKTDKVITLDSMKCTINRTFTQDASRDEDKRRNHKNTDSNWRVIGVGSLHNSQITTTDLDDKANSIDYYAWDASLNKLNSTTCNQYGSGSPTTFLVGHAYMVQWEGKITWKSASVPASLAARRSPIEKKNYEVELDLNQNDIMYDRTYVVLQENASPEYVLNEDLYKATNSNYPNIYAFAGAYDCGVSRIPIESTTVPVGVIIRKNGTYTFSMPSNFDGTVTLIDTYTQTRTNLGLEDYEVYLNKGTMDDRFLLEININKVPTAIDGVEGGSLKDGKAHKFIMNDMMYILKDGVIYDARGNRVK